MVATDTCAPFFCYTCDQNGKLVEYFYLFASLKDRPCSTVFRSAADAWQVTIQGLPVSEPPNTLRLCLLSHRNPEKTRVGIVITAKPVLWRHSGKKVGVWGNRRRCSEQIGVDKKGGPAQHHVMCPQLGTCLHQACAANVNSTNA